MNLLLSTLAAAPQTGGFDATFLIMIVAIFAIMYFFMIRPQNKKQKETQKMIDALKKGDKVVTIGGIHGVISSTKERTVIVKVQSGAEVEFNRTAIATVIADKPAEPAKPAEKKSLFGKKAKKEEPVAEAVTSENKPEETAEPTAESGEKKDE